MGYAHAGADEILDVALFGRTPDEVTAQQRLVAILQEGDQPVASVLRVGFHTLYGDHPYGIRPIERLLPSGSEERARREMDRIRLLREAFPEEPGEEAVTLARRVLVLHHGAAIADGPPAAIVREPAVIQSYLGEEALG